MTESRTLTSAVLGVAVIAALTVILTKPVLHPRPQITLGFVMVAASIPSLLMILPRIHPSTSGIYGVLFAAGGWLLISDAVYTLTILPNPSAHPPAYISSLAVAMTFITIALTEKLHRHLPPILTR